MSVGVSGEDGGEPIFELPRDPDPGLSDLELVADIWSADAREAREAALRAAAVSALARRRRAEDDRAFGSRGGPGLDSRLRENPALCGVSETFVSELALIRRCSESEAESLAIESLTLTEKLTGTWGALYAGRIDVRKMRALVDLLGPVKLSTAQEIERLALEPAERMTVAELRARVRRLLARLDREALERRRAERQQRADVRSYPTGDGMARLEMDLPWPVSTACFDAIDQYARMLRADGDTRPMGVLRTAVAADLILRPWDTSRPPVTARLTVRVTEPALRSDGEGEAEVDGEVVTAAQCRELLEQLDMLGLRQAPRGGCVQIAVERSDGRLVAVATRRQLRRAATGSRARRCRRRRDRADATATTPRPTPRPTPRSSPNRGDGVREEAPGLRPPAPTAAYRPTAEQRRFVRERDRTCRWPGCRRRPARCDIDHGQAYDAGGPTDCWNLCCLCRRHHRIKTFAPGWGFQLLPDGKVVVRTPSGVSRITRPPGWYPDPEPDPPWLEEQAPPDPLLT